MSAPPCRRRPCGNTVDPRRHPSGLCPAHRSPERASYGVTPFRGRSRVGDAVSLADPYYESPRYEQFEGFVARRGDELDVDVEGSVRALGLWEGTNEPSSAISVRGERASIEALAREVGTRYGQFAVRVIYSPGSGEHTRYRFTLPVGEEPEVTLSVLRDAGIPGARVTEDELDLADAEPLSEATVRVLESFYGEVRREACEVVRVLCR